MTLDATDTDIDEYIEQMRVSGVMGKSSRRLRLLEHLIKAEADGEGDKLKAYSIGLDIFQKSESFDPSTDSIVRVEIGRLRSAIALFEASEFADTNINVEIPVGTYRPTISKRDTPKDAPNSGDPIDGPRAKSARRWGLPVALAAMVCLSLLGLWFYTQKADAPIGTTPNSIAIQLQDLKGDPEIGTSVGLALRRALARTKSITVLSALEENSLPFPPDFALRGVVAPIRGERHRIDVELLNAYTKRVVWARSLILTDPSDVDDVIKSTLSNELRVRIFGATKDVLEGRDPLSLTPQQLFVMATWVPGPAINAIEWELERVALMNIALEKDPEFGAAHSVMADKLAYLANVYGRSNTENLREKAVWHAQRAMELAPSNADVVFNVAQSQWHSGKVEASLASMQRVVELDEGHDLARFLALVIPYTCAAAPDNVVKQAIAFDASLSPDNPIRWLTLTWIGWLHAYREEYELALAAERRAALIFQIPYTFMRHAMLLNKLGKTDEAAILIRSQQSNWPDIDPNHFSDVTIPRLCSENADSERFISNYQELSQAMDGRL